MCFPVPVLRVPRRYGTFRGFLVPNIFPSYTSTKIGVFLLFLGFELATSMSQSKVSW